MGDGNIISSAVADSIWTLMGDEWEFGKLGLDFLMDTGICVVVRKFDL